jgi:hypothetical protein
MGKRLLLIFWVIGCVLPAILQPASAENPGQQKKILLKFHSFSMNPGDKIVGTTVTVSQGEIVQALIPRGWIRKYSGSPNRTHTVHCFSPHSSLGIAASGRMPVLSIIDNSGSSGRPLTIESSVDIEGGDGKVYTKQLQESDFNIQ